MAYSVECGVEETSAHIIRSDDRFPNAIDKRRQKRDAMNPCRENYCRDSLPFQVFPTSVRNSFSSDEHPNRGSQHQTIRYEYKRDRQGGTQPVINIRGKTKRAAVASVRKVNISTVHR